VYQPGDTRYSETAFQEPIITIRLNLNDKDGPHPDAHRGAGRCPFAGGL